MQESKIITFQTSWKGVESMKKSIYMNFKDEIYQALLKTHSNLSSKTKVYFDITVPLSGNYFIVESFKIVLSFVKKDVFIPPDILTLLLKQENFALINIFGEDTSFQIVSRHHAFDGQTLLYQMSSNKLTVYNSYTTKTPSLSTILTSYLNDLHLWKTQSIPSSIWPSTYLQQENIQPNTV